MTKWVLVFVVMFGAKTPTKVANHRFLFWAKHWCVSAPLDRNYDLFERNDDWQRVPWESDIERSVVLAIDQQRVVAAAFPEWFYRGTYRRTRAGCVFFDAHQYGVNPYGVNPQK